MSCDGWSVNTKAVVSSSMSPKLIKNYQSSVLRENVNIVGKVDFGKNLSVKVARIFNDEGDHPHEMIVSYRDLDGFTRYALLNHNQIHHLRRAPR